MTKKILFQQQANPQPMTNAQRIQQITNIFNGFADMKNAQSPLTIWKNNAHEVAITVGTNIAQTNGRAFGLTGSKAANRAQAARRQLEEQIQQVGNTIAEGLNSLEENESQAFGQQVQQVINNFTDGQLQEIGNLQDEINRQGIREQDKREAAIQNRQYIFDQIQNLIRLRIRDRFPDLFNQQGKLYRHTVEIEMKYASNDVVVVKTALPITRDRIAELEKLTHLDYRLPEYDRREKKAKAKKVSGKAKKSSAQYTCNGYNHKPGCSCGWGPRPELKKPTVRKRTSQ